MRHMLAVLKSDLSCGQDSETELIHAGHASLDPLDKCESLSSSERSTDTPSREDSSEDTTEIMDAATESEFCGLEFEEHPDSSHTCEAALKSIACDSDSEVNKELDELEESFADLHLSRNYS